MVDNVNAGSRLVSAVMAAVKANVSPGILLGFANVFDALAEGGSTAEPTRISIPFADLAPTPKPKGKATKAKGKKAKGKSSGPADAESVHARLTRGKPSAASAKYRKMGGDEQQKVVAASIRANPNADTETVALHVLDGFGTAKPKGGKKAAKPKELAAAAESSAGNG